MTTGRLRDFVHDFTAFVERSGGDEERVFKEGRALLADLIAHDDWLPEAFARSDPNRYQQYLLHCDPLERFSVASFVWGPGQKTPVHDHTVWGMVGVLRGAELCEEYGVDGGRLTSGSTHRVELGAIDLVSPRVGDIHRVSNALANEASISIHVYGANIGAVKRNVYDPATGRPKEFISGYSSAVLPNIWDRSTESASA
jgi:predicted metal-dependent enzyme (double-stranded beta helix superfamily)